MKKIIFALILSTFIVNCMTASTIDEQQSDLIYVNGLLTIQEAAIAHAGDLSILAGQHVDYAYNQTNGFATDLIEAYKQKMLTDPSLTWNLFWGNLSIGLRVFAEIYYEYAAYYDHNIDLSGLKEKVHNGIMSGHGVILVSHSQGNLYANEVYQGLIPWMQK